MLVEVQQRSLGFGFWRRWWSVACHGDRLWIESIIGINSGVTGGWIVQVRLPVTHLEPAEQSIENEMGGTSD
jgi:hypothetical protein